MAREVQIPIVLWISAALVFHAVGGGGGLEVAEAAIDKADLRDLVKLERKELRPADDSFEIMDITSQPDVSVTQPAEAPDKESAPSDDEVPDDAAKAEAKAKQAKEKEPEPPKPEEIAKAPEAEKKPPPALPLPVPAAPAPPPPPPKKDGREAIRQHVQDKNQPDNPNANKIGDDANTVAEETQARIRSHDQDMKDPTAGAQRAMGPKDTQGNSDKNKEAESEDRAGREDKAPGEKARYSESATHSTPAQNAPKGAPAAVAGGSPGKGPGAKGGGAMPSPASPPPSPGGAGPASPEVASGDRGSWSVDPANPGGDGTSRIAGRKRPGQASALSSPVHVGSIGLGGAGTPGGPNINLNMAGVVAAVGDDKLRQEREADGASRRGEHAGRMIKNTDFQRYKAAIENYIPSVKEGDKTALNAARVPWATYLNTIHNRIHPLFGDRELDSMDKTQDKMFADQKMFAVAEIVLEPNTGRVVRRGIMKGSGSTAFDLIVVKTIDAAGPYGKAPDAVVSPDGKVYLHWEFHRNHFDACSTRNAFPIMRAATAVRATPPTGAPPKAPPKSSDERPGAAPGPLRPLRE